jgi:hypothetical protein
MSIEEVYKKVAAKHNITEDTVKQIHLDFWKGVKKVVQEDTAKDILIGGFGTLYFDQINLNAATNELRKRFEYNENYLREGGDWMRYLYIYRSLCYKEKQINNLWKSLNRRKNRKLGERGL